MITPTELLPTWIPPELDSSTRSLPKTGFPLKGDSFKNVPLFFVYVNYQFHCDSSHTGLLPTGIHPELDSSHRSLPKTGFLPKWDVSGGFLFREESRLGKSFMGGVPWEESWAAGIP